MPALHTTETIVVDGVARTYIQHIPANLKPNPDLVLGFHGGGGNGKEWWDKAWVRQAEKGFIIVCPTARTGPATIQGDHWVGLGDTMHSATLDEHADEKFMLAIIDKLRASHNVGNVYASGFSSGAKMAYHLYVTQPDKFAGFGMLGHGWNDAIVAHGMQTHKPLRITYGTADKNYETPDYGLDAFETMLWTKDQLGITDKPTKTVFKGRKTTAKTLTWQSPSGIALQMSRITDMKHHWSSVTKGDPYYEDNALIEFWQKYAGFKA